MSHPRRTPASAFAIAALLGTPVIVPPARASDVKPYVSAGPSIPVHFPEVRRGFGLGIGFEAEGSPQLSAVFRLDLNPAVFTWSGAARGYIGTFGPARPYADAGVGIRTGGGHERDGPAMVLRVGIATVASKRPGLFLEAGWDRLFRSPDRNEIATVQLGVVLPEP